MTIINQPRGNYYIIADHLRTTIFALADGATFEPKGRGYILKKLVKKVVLLTHFWNFSGENLLTIAKKIITINLELTEKENYITENLAREISKEKEFLARAGEKITQYCQKNPSSLIPATIIFFWYDTEGIPGELIRYQLEQRGKNFSEPEFQKLLTQQKELGQKDRRQKKIPAFSG